MPSDLAGCSRPPAQVFDVALLDLDGVVYLGDELVPHAADALSAAAALGIRRAYVTNNALRTPEALALRLRGMNIPADADDVVTSAQAAARMLRDRLGADARVLVAGGEGLLSAVQEVGLRPVAGADDDPAAVVLGYDPTLDYARLAEATLAVRRGALFVASNRDATLPTPRGLLPGMGALTAFVVTGSGREPLVAGKPEGALHAESIRRSAAQCPLVVGDRLDTDAQGARRAGTPCLLVLTGVTGVSQLLAAPAEQRPDLIADDLRGLLAIHPAAGAGHCGEARAAATGGVVRVEPGGPPIDALRAAVSAAWSARDAGVECHQVTGLPAPYPAAVDIAPTIER